MKQLRNYIDHIIVTTGPYSEYYVDSLDPDTEEIVAAPGQVIVWWDDDCYQKGLVTDKVLDSDNPGVYKVIDIKDMR